jgi:hypothetical protein
MSRIPEKIAAAVFCRKGEENTEPLPIWALSGFRIAGIEPLPPWEIEMSVEKPENDRGRIAQRN